MAAAVGQALPADGVAVTSAGIAVRQRAITSLDPYFTGHVLVQPSQPVVSSGL
jgi:3-hydroxymyristoyl/3-hydroxydecanoyl-(acyl carrier protein) dehydratase